MNIKYIKLDGFRNIANVSINTESITSLLSINSYGKSNFLNGIIFGINFIHAIPNYKTNMMKDDAYKPINKELYLNNFSFEMELLNIHGFTSAIYGYSFAWENNIDGPEIITEYLKVKENDSQKYTYFIKRDKKSGFYKSSVSSSCTKKMKIENNELLINKLSAYDNLYFLDLIKDINNINVYVDSHFNTNEEYNIQMFLQRNYSDYNLNETTNVPRILFKIKKDYPDKYDLIVNTLKDIFSFIKDIKVVEFGVNKEILALGINNEQFVTANNIYQLYVLEENLNEPVEISNMSDGVRRVLLILTTLVLAQINHYSLIAIEEPENSLNPKILQRYLATLNSFAKNTKIIITSHSPYLINYMNPSNIYIGLPNNKGVAIFKKIKDKSIDKLLLDAKNMDMLVGDYLFSLMSGDDTDLKTIDNYVE